ncbi:peptidylprolyl isomerase : Peptidyl-prolyl cis-trans isomerase OS=Laribacter hongkongensis (strain HLHK9) GN=fkpA PE=4 SV=1: FKBP_C [Gemmata massiliana]|uniref:Peptidyl-prolyl cis-trans isomerase n=1 Tax=Gemmata massiliana TaxID=1210884 RepID=A0A6P2DF96_9BACT|nr:FKBP-type peptidyl-prolyl cis-trans isomerase [Gemmata massiliana]VTS00354.1 peptidylprolyl isomerase : Peptidyl-prolyl cis-trans isomerase OS=Laribacter hongkongensis (strain HLHK9) GN=fkpA PE=4 SV=1: FKBP_C [Gemmata massiliana]
MPQVPPMPAVDAAEWTKQASGLEIWDSTVGEGDAVKPGATVTVHYTGWLTNGKMFDSSVARGQTISFSLNQVIKGWQEGIPGMKPGGTRRLKIPAVLGYGATGAGRDIPPNAVLIFEVELISSK